MMADPKAANVISRLYDIPGNCIQAMPIFLAEKNYQSPTSTKTTAFQKGFNTDLTYNDWVLQCPAYVKDPGSVMCLYQTVFWMDSYPVEEKLGSLATGPDTSLMVEIGGGVGEQATAFRNKFPHLTGRIIVQDSPAVLTKATPAPGITFTEHSLFKPQPITAAKLYYLRHVLQKWPDNDCVKILKNVIPAMGTESRLVIDDVVMPESQASWQSVYLDLILMNTTGGAFRTRLQWDALLNRAGLKILDVSQYDGAEMQHIIVAVPK
ncbi:hypothetical protein N0V88_005186 [Collariella sp. IMI 366227]|nr:hypothetical protein N0V88_005186 [Collariella sp. IMI 366227]